MKTGGNMKNSIFVVILVTLFSFSLNFNFTQAAVKQTPSLTKLQSRTNSYTSVFHDNCWWIQEYADDGQFIREWIDIDHP